MDWQLLFVFVLVLLATLYLARRTLRTWRGKSGGCGPCKCPSAAPSKPAGAQTWIPVEQLQMRSRRDTVA
jgi:hypothetical protein